MSSESSDSEPDCGYDVCSRRSNSCALPFDPNNIERIILSICDRFDFRVILSDNRTKGALLVTAGLSFAGGLVGRHYGGKVGAAVGGAIGGACGLGLVADTFRIEIVWDRETAVMTGALAVAGGLLGGYAGGRLGAALGAGIGGATGLGVSTVVSLREIWASIKERLKEVLFIIFNYIRRLDASDYIRAVDILMACSASRRELVFTIVDFIAEKLGRQVLSSITAA